MTKKLHLIGYASGLAGADRRTADGPTYLKQSPLLDALIQSTAAVAWGAIISEREGTAPLRVDESVSLMCNELASYVSALTTQRKRYSIIGGDHTSAIGTWSGVYHAMHAQGDLGLIWIDAHMDSHTPETSESGRIHGMPLACLMGYGYPSLTGILDAAPKLKPQNIALIGVRSYESGEAEFLKRLNVRVYFMDEVKERGFATVLQEAVDEIKSRTVGYGLSIDLDALDPKEIPGVDVPEKDGINTQDFCTGLSQIAADPNLIATEIIEFNPLKDKDKKTEKFIVTLLAILAKAT